MMPPRDWVRAGRGHQQPKLRSERASSLTWIVSISVAVATVPRAGGATVCDPGIFLSDRSTAMEFAGRLAKPLSG